MVTSGSRRVWVVFCVVLALVAGLLVAVPFVPAVAQEPPPDEPPRPKGDIVFVVDESGSMGPDIADVRARIGDVVAQLTAADVDFRIGVVGYSGGNRVYQSLTDDPALIQAGVNALTSNKPNPEAGYSATVVAMGDQLGHRADAATCQVLISDENADVTAAYPQTKNDARAALRSRNAAFFGVVTGESTSEFDYGPQPGSLAAETLGGTFDLLAFRADAGPVLDALFDDCINKITTETPLEVSAGEDVSVPEGSTVTLAGSASSSVQGIESRGRFAVDAKANIFAAGQSSPTAAGGVVPVEVGAMVPGTIVSFSGASGETRVSSTCGGVVYPPDGAGTNINVGATGGISGIRTVGRQMLVGVFVGDTAPVAPAPVQLDYLSGTLEFESLRPQVGQTFFVGDGLSPAGVRQRFAVPPGATRLFLGLATTAYANNCGGYEIDVVTSTGPAPLSYDWELVSSSGPPIELSAENIVDPSFAAFDDGTYLFRMTATDGVETLSDDVTVTVRNEAPVISQVASDAAATDGLVEVTIAYSDPGPFDTHRVRVDWGDGSPIEELAAQAGGTGWGFAYAGHRYAAVGSPTVTVTVVDDDGGASAPVTTTVDVGGAGVGETLPGSPAALFAASTTDAEAIRVSGSHNSVSGVVHANGGIRISGSDHTYIGGTEYATTIDVSGSGTTFDPPAVQVPPTAFPSTHVWADYQTGGRAAVAAGSLHRQIPASECKGNKWMPKAPLAAGLYTVPCGVQISGSDIAGNVTIAASGEIKLSGSGHNLTPFTDGLLFFSNSTSSRAVDLSGSHQDFAGSMLAPAGGIEVTGSHHALGCGVMAQSVRISGSHNQIAGVECGQTGGGEGTTVSIAAPPVVAPNLTATLASDRADLFPGEQINYTASLRNGLEDPAASGSTVVLMPALLGVDNRDTAPVTVGDVVYTFEVHDPTTGEWTTWASTATDAPADQQIVTLDGRATPTSGVDYAASGFEGTVIDPGALGSWATAAQLRLSTDQTTALLDPLRVDAVRNTVTIETDRTLVRKLTRFDDSPLDAIRTAPAATVSNAEINLSRPGGGAAVYDQTTTPELATLLPGASVTVAAASTVALLEPAAANESDSAYIARLAAADGQRLVASTYGTATAGVGGVFAAQQAATTTVHVPVVAATIDAPTQVAPGSAVTVDVAVANWGSAEATDLVVALDVSGRGTVPVEGLPASLAPGATASGTATFATTAVPTSYGSSALVTWSHPGGDPGLYGPLRPTATTETKPPVALDVVKYADAETVVDGISYVIQATNTGANPLTSVTLTDPIDAEATIIAATASTTAGTITAGSNATDRTVTVDVGVLEPGASVTVTFAVDHLRARVGTTEIVNQATLASAELGSVLSDDPTRPGTADATITPITVPTGGGGGGPDGENDGPTGVVCDPADGTTITAPTPFSCTITPRPDTEVTTWTASILPVGGAAEEAVVLTTGTGPLAAGQIDPTVLPNGVFEIVILATDTTGGRSELTSSIVIDGQLKLGRYSITYQDMAVPVGGIPIQVNRTYDTLDRNRQGDFGYGWDLEVANFRVQTNGPLGEGGWEQYSCGGGFIFVSLCYRTTRAHFTTVTWPDGRTETFDFTPKGLNTFFSTPAIPAYIGRSNTTSTLEPAPGDESAGNRGDGNLYAGSFGEGDIYDPTRFVLVAKDGTRFLLDAKTGLVEATDRNGNRITVTPDGITSSNGPGIVFGRDGDGRIEKVTGPDGSDVEYRYNADGDLDLVLDQKDRETSFTYEGDHYLVDTDDPGPGLFRKLGYHPDGRLASITDANNHTTNVVTTLDQDTRSERVTSPDGLLNTTTTFDERGNTVERDDVFADPTGDSHVTTWSYSDDGRDLITSRSDPAGNTWTAQHDDDGNVEVFTDAEQATTRITYDDFGAPTSIVDANGVTSTYTYDSRTGNLTDIDEAGRVQRIDYDSRGNPIRHVDGLNREQTWTYTPAGFLASHTDANQELWSFRTDAMGRVEAEIDPANRETVHDYDEVGNLISSTRPMSLARQWGYDAVDRLVSMTDEDDHTTTYGYDAAGNRTRITDPLLNSTTFAYDAQNRRIATTDPLDRVTRYTYDGGGRLETITDPLLRVTTYGYDRAGRQNRVSVPGRGPVVTTFDGNGLTTSVTNGESETVHYAYDPVGQLDEIRDALERRTTFDYDTRGNRTDVTNPAGERTHYDYDAADQLTMVTTGIGPLSVTGMETTTFEYDGNGNQTVTRDGTNRATTISYDERNLVRFVRDSAGHPTEYRYDDAGRLTRTINASGITTDYGYDGRSNQTSIADSLGNTTNTGYDPAGRMVTQTDGRRYLTTYGYNAASELISIRDARGGQVGFGYDDAGQRTRVTDPNNKTRTSTYTPAGDLETQTDALDRVTRFGYDLAGRQTSRTDARNLTTAFGYDDAGQLTGELRQEPGGALTAIAYGYDNAGRRTTVTDPTGTTTTTYDPASRITQVAAPQGTIDYGYDAAGRRTAMTLPAVAGAVGGTVTYTHDLVGRVQTISEPGRPAATTALAYTLDGRMTTVTRPNGVVSSYSYDPAGRGTGMTYTGPDGELARFGYTLDANGNRTAVRYAYEGGPETTETYTLDEINRLTGVTYSDTGQADTYSYDNAGNRTTKTSTGGTDPGTTNYHYDDAQQLTATDGTAVAGGSEAFTYDDNGNLIATTTGAEFTYDAANQMTGATVDGDATAYTYDADGVRVAVGGSPQLHDTTSGLPTLVNDGTGTQTTHGAGGILTQDSAGSSTYPVTDALGSIRGQTDNAGDLDGTASYDVYGTPRGATIAGGFGYTGEQTDTTGLVNLRARMYDPTTGRFQQTDSVQPNAVGSQGWSLYSYAEGNPGTLVDPSGHMSLATYSKQSDDARKEISVLAGPKTAVKEAVAPTLARYGITLFIRVMITTLAECLLGVPISAWAGNFSLSSPLVGFLCKPESIPDTVPVPLPPGPDDPDPCKEMPTGMGSFVQVPRYSISDVGALALQGRMSVGRGEGIKPPHNVAAMKWTDCEGNAFLSGPFISGEAHSEALALASLPAGARVLVLFTERSPCGAGRVGGGCLGLLGGSSAISGGTRIEYLVHQGHSAQDERACFDPIWDAEGVPGHSYGFPRPVC